MESTLEHPSIHAENATRTWKDPYVAQRRRARHRVLVNGKRYSSMSQACIKLRIVPIGLGRARQILAAQGRVVYRGYTFERVPDPV